MKKKLFLFAGLSLALCFSSCSDDDDKYYRKGEGVPVTMTLDGGTGGSMAVNSVYLDLSTEKQTAVERSSWHLAFNCGSDFGVFLNSTLGSRVVEVTNGETVNTVLTEETNNTYKEALSLGMGAGSWSLVDNLDGTIAGTAIKENKTYIYDSGDAGLELYKINVSKKNNNTYLLTYAVWNSAEVTSVEIVKNSSYDKIGVSFITKQTVNIQPTKGDWDLIWGRNTYKSGAMDVPFVISDVVFVNSTNGVTTARIMTDSISYTNYSEANIATTTFSAEKDVIGTEWRVVKVDASIAKSTTKAATDRFYVIKDPSGNVFKLRFIAASADDGGERGKPEIEYELVKGA